MYHLLESVVRSSAQSPKHRVHAAGFFETNPKWSDAEKAMDFASEKQVFDTKFDEFTCRVKYVGERVAEWNDVNL